MKQITFNKTIIETNKIMTSVKNLFKYVKFQFLTAYSLFRDFAFTDTKALVSGGIKHE